MAGREAIRGFSIQTLICLLDALVSGDEWVAVTIEPDTENDKVDLLWEYASHKRGVQVKSSKNPIGRADIEKWCQDLKASKSADSYELRLSGPVASSALRGLDTGGVVVPPSSSIVLSDLIEQAITKVDRYLVDANVEAVPLPVREALVSICASKLIIGSATGHRVERNEFHGWLLHWIITSYPDAVNARLSANCEVLWGSIEFSSPTSNQGAFALSLPVSIYNVGPGAAVVDWFVVRVRSQDRQMLYGPTEVRRGDRMLPFAAFVVGPRELVEREVVFLPVEREGFSTDKWPVGRSEITLLVKFTTNEMPTVVKTVPVEIGGKHMALLNRKSSLQCTISTIQNYLDEL